MELIKHFGRNGDIAKDVLKARVRGTLRKMITKAQSAPVRVFISDNDVMVRLTKNP